MNDIRLKLKDLGTPLKIGQPVSLTIDGQPVTVARGTSVMRAAAEVLGRIGGDADFGGGHTPVLELISAPYCLAGWVTTWRNRGPQTVASRKLQSVCFFISDRFNHTVCLR